MGDRPSRTSFHANVEALLRRPGIGHNQGPPLDMSGEAWVWRRAVAKAWKTPPREIALKRMERAEAMGLSYRDYTAVLMDRGRAVNTLVLSLPALVEARARGWGSNRDAALQLRAEVAAKVPTLKPLRLLVLADRYADERLVGARDETELGEEVRGLLPTHDPAIALVDSGLRRARGTADPRVSAVKDYFGRNWIVPSEAMMVGVGPDDLYVAEQTEVALFKLAWEYFSAVPVR